MFTKSNNNAYNFPTPRSSAAALVGLHANDLLHHHHHDMLAAAHHFAAANHDLSAHGGGGEPAKAAAAKKDRHSKIDTAQGPRDRRVRLSIGVARKFFDLQENLGFDKPSKTLDWLLTNSKTAIKDLEEMREAAAAAATAAGGGESEVDSGEKSGGGSSAGKMKAAARESRAKARARARERTREKMCIKKLNETRNVVCSSNGDFNSIQFMNNQLEFRKIAASSSNINLGFHSYEAAAAVAANHEDLIQESIVIKRKVKNPMGFQQNLIISSSNYGVPPPYNAAAAENWDNICAILDQHKFINSASNN